MKTTLLSTHHLLSPLDQGNITPSFRGDGWKQEALFSNELSRALAAVTRLTVVQNPETSYSTVHEPILHTTEMHAGNTGVDTPCDTIHSLNPPTTANK